MNLLALRSHNTALVLDLLRAAGGTGISRLELAERTGLTPQAVSKIIARLRADGLAAEAGHRASTGGKPRTVLRLVPEAGHAVGVHLDRDGLRAVLVDLTGAVVGERRASVDLGVGAEAVVEAVAVEVAELVAAGLLGEGPVHGGSGRAASGASETAGPTTEAAPSTTAPSTAAPSGDRAPCASPVAGLAGSRVSASSVDRAPSASPVAGLAGSRVSAPSADRAPTAPPAASPASTPSAGLTPPAPLSAPPAAPLGSAPSLLGVGIALPGPLDHTHGILHRVTGFPEWDGFPLRDVLAGRLGVPVVVDKDTNAAALGLAVGGEGGSFAYLHAGTGLGAGLVIGGAVHRGARTGAGEFGHQVVQLDGPLCGCGNRGCVEALCLAAVARGDLAEAARVLGVGAGNLVALLDVDLVLLGGRAVATAPEAFVRGVAAVLDERARRAGEEPVPVRVASGGVAEGAAQLVLGPVFGRTDG